MKPVRLVLADDHEIIRLGLRTLLQGQPGWSVVGEAVNGEEAVEMTLSLRPDMALMDIAMPKLNGFEATRRILAQDPHAKILLLSGYDSREVIADVLDSGAKGYVLKSDAARDLVAAVEAVRSNQTFFTPKVADLVLSRHLKRVKEHADKMRKA